jgi:hypothetical protein
MQLKVKGPPGNSAGLWLFASIIDCDNAWWHPHLIG